MASSKPSTHAAARKVERDRDRAQAMGDYEAERRAKDANMLRLKAQRLAREDAAAQTIVACQSVKKKAAIRGVGPTKTRSSGRAAS
jgi:hypothetical protein